jgi:hypothetical protein
MGYTSRVRCINCKFYHVSWDADRPYGCTKLGFKSRIEPSTYVIQISGNICQSFESKNSRK